MVSARVDHEDAFAFVRVLLVDGDDAGRDARAVEEVGRQADDALDVSAPDDSLADGRLRVAPEEYAVRQEGALAGV